MAYTTTIPGLPGGPVTTNHKIIIKLIPAWNTYQRPGIKARFPRRSVQHGTGNPNSMAPGEAIYVVDQQAEGRQASYHSITDDNVTYICLPADEVGWHAADGAGPGNYNGFANEMVENADLWADEARARQTIENSAELMGIISARFDIELPEQHWDFNWMLSAALRHDCPNKLRYRIIAGVQAWLLYVERWKAHKAAEIARMAGTAPIDSGFKVGDRIEVIAAALNIRTGWGLSGRVVATLTPGRTGAVIGDDTGRFTAQADGYSWLNVRIDGFGTGWVATGLPGDPWLAKTAAPAPAPAPKPTYAAPLKVPALLETQLTFEDKYNTVPGITTVNELEFVFVADVIEFTEATPALAYGDLKAPPAKSPYQVHERAIAAWLVQGKDGVWYYLLTGGDDEWIRVEYTKTVRVSDAPLVNAAAA